MAIYCKGGCAKFPDTETISSAKNLQRFLMGYKLCRECEYFLLTLDIACKCCGGMFSVTPKTGNSRRKLQAMREVKRIEA